jgi:alkylated DNA repair dioxygenase AlkB
MKRYVSLDQQRDIQQLIWKLGRKNRFKDAQDNREEEEDQSPEEPGGFYRPLAYVGSEAKFNLQMLTLGKHWNPLTRVYEHRRNDYDKRPVHPIPACLSYVCHVLPQIVLTRLSELCVKALSDAQQLDNTLPSMTPTALIVNFYNENGSLGLHKDKTESEVRLFFALTCMLTAALIGVPAERPTCCECVTR